MILGFDEAFAPLIVAGTKIHTIRAGQRWQAGEVDDLAALSPLYLQEP